MFFFDVRKTKQQQIRYDVLGEVSFAAKVIFVV